MTLNLQIMVHAVGKKVRYYKELGFVKNDFNKDELKESHFAVIVDGEIVGWLNSAKTVSVIFD